MFYLDEAAIAPFLGIERAFSPQDIDCRGALDGTHNIWLLGGGRVDCDGWNLTLAEQSSAVRKIWPKVMRSQDPPSVAQTKRHIDQIDEVKHWHFRCGEDQTPFTFEPPSQVELIKLLARNSSAVLNLLQHQSIYRGVMCKDPVWQSLVDNILTTADPLLFRFDADETRNTDAWKLNKTVELLPSVFDKIEGSVRELDRIGMLRIGPLIECDRHEFGVICAVESMINDCETNYVEPTAKRRTRTAQSRALVDILCSDEYAPLQRKQNFAARRHIQAESNQQRTQLSPRYIYA